MKKVMLVEDEELILLGLENIIDWDALDMKIVHRASNGKEALECFRKEAVDIVVTDVEMPQMDGLTFLAELRKFDEKARCIILSGYDEFEYARRAVPLDVEGYILKPIDEEKLKDALSAAARKLEHNEVKKISDVEDHLGWVRFMEGRLPAAEMEKYQALFQAIPKDQKGILAVISIDLDSMAGRDITDVVLKIRELSEGARPVYINKGSLLVISCVREKCTKDQVVQHFSNIQNRIEEELGIFTFMTLSSFFHNYGQLQECYRVCSHLQKYRLIDGFGSCIDEEYLKNRKTKDIAIDEMMFRKMVLKKDQEGAVNYIEDLLLNNVGDTGSVEALFQMALRIAMLLHDIKVEYKLAKTSKLQKLSEIVGEIYQAEDLIELKMILISETIDIIKYLHTDSAQYTPVVKQLMEEIQKNHKEDMNLKTLAYKYHMNASYLGQIFQKETGCSFNQYLSNTKNSMARSLILNTNMKINDIAREVGYPDTSYFYRKFKQCYGVSPASLRNMKKYNIEEPYTEE